MEQLELLLLQFLVPDNEARKNAEEQIKQLAKDPQLVVALLHQMRTAHAANVRQLAAVLLRKKIIGHWMKLNPQVHNCVKTALLESIIQEHSHSVRRACADVISIIAKHAVPSGEWPELLPFLLQCSQSPQEDHREMAMVLFTSLTETIGEVLRPHFATLQSIFSNGLKDQESNKVRMAALKAVGSLAGFAESDQEILMFRELIPAILDVTRYCVATGSEDLAITAFDIFDDLIESPTPLLGPSIPVIVHFALEVAVNKNLEPTTRDQGIQIIQWLSKYKPKTLVKHKVVADITNVMCQILSEVDEGRDEFDVSPDQSAAQVLDVMALNLPKKHVFPHVFNFALSNFQNPDYNCREAAVMSLGVIAEGCYEAMKANLNDMLNLVLQAFKDNEQAVRGAASFTLGQFGEHLQPEIVNHYERVLPCIFSVLNDSSVQVQEKAYYALAAFCENLGQEILPFLPVLMERLLEALQCNRRDVQETCMSAIGSAAAASGASFTPYAARVLEMIKGFMILIDDKDLCVRARATELVGTIGAAVGRSYMEPFLHGFIEAAIAGFTLNYSELREYTHGFFGSIAELLQADITQYLPLLVPLALDSCSLDDGTAIDVEESDGEEEEAANGFGGVSSDDDSDKGVRVRNISIRTGVLDEKAAATQALGLFALHSKAGFMPYLEKSLLALKKHASYFHEDVRLQAVISLQHMLTATQAAFPSTATHISPEAKHILDIVMDVYLKNLGDDDKQTVSQVCCCIGEVLKSQYSSTMEPYMMALCKEVLTLLREEGVCQQSDDTDDEEGHGSEEDAILMESVCDLIPIMACRIGPSFEPVFRPQFEALLKFTKATRSPSDRTMVVACCAEVAKGIGKAFEPYVPSMMPVAIKEMSSAVAGNRRNAAYCVGELCDVGGDKAREFYPNILAALFPLFNDESMGVRDNAAGAIARMLMAQPHAIAMSQALPILIKALPLKEDLEESAVIYNCLCSLVRASHPEILPHVPQLVHVFAKVVHSQEESGDVKAGIGSAISHLLANYRDEMQPLLSSIPAEEASALAHVM